MLSVVWLNLLKVLPRHFDRVTFIDRQPGGTMSGQLRNDTGLRRVESARSLKDDIAGILKPMAWNASSPANQSNPIVIFFSTYYTYEQIPGICNMRTFCLKMADVSDVS
jgi:hypothetical protein